jgi:hypothetical protein
MTATITYSKFSNQTNINDDDIKILIECSEVGENPFYKCARTTTEFG